MGFRSQEEIALPTISDEDADKPLSPIELRFRLIPGSFAVCRLAADAPVPQWAWNSPFSSVTRTADELSIVCSADDVPPDVNADQRWICLKIEGPFAFSQVGILASIIDPLAENGVPIFAISTYDTDYVLIKEEFWEVACGALQRAGHELLP